MKPLRRSSVPGAPAPPAWQRRLLDNRFVQRVLHGRFHRVAMRSFSGWWADNIPRMGAALAYYTLFALAPVLLVAIAVGGMVFGDEAVRGEIFGQIAGLMGPEGARTIQDMLAAAARTAPSTLVMVSGLVTFFLGATGAFLELQAALNTVWRVTPRQTGNALRDFLKERLISAGLVLAFAFLLLTALVISAGLTAISKYAGHLLPGGPVSVKLLDIVVSTTVITFLFAMIYKFMPYEKLPWRNVWAGALTAAALFVVGKSLLGPYFAGSKFISSYGAAGSVIVVLVWVYWSTQILLFGAEVTRAVAQEYGPQPPPISVGPRRIAARS
jgi:membrane protein